MFQTDDFLESLNPQQQRHFKSTYGQSKDGKICIEAYDKRWQDMPVEDMTSRMLMLGCPSSCGIREKGMRCDTLGDIEIGLEGNEDYGFRDTVIDKLFPKDNVQLPIGEVNVPPRGKARLETIHRKGNFLYPGICSTLFQLYKRQYYTEAWCREMSVAMAAHGIDLPFPLGPCLDPAELEQRSAELAQ